MLIGRWADLTWAILIGWAASAAITATAMGLSVRLRGRRQWLTAAVATAAFAVAPAVPTLVRLVQGVE